MREILNEKYTEQPLGQRREVVMGQESLLAWLARSLGTPFAGRLPLSHRRPGGLDGGERPGRPPR